MILDVLQYNPDKHAYNVKPLSDIPSIKDWEKVKIEKSSENESLIPLGSFSDYSDIYTTSIYAGELHNSPYSYKSLEGSLISIFVRESVAKQLREAQSYLPKQHYVVVFDGYRPLQVQAALYKVYFQALQQKFPSLPFEELQEETQKYVSLPSNDVTRPSPHNTGGAVDVAIIKLSPEADNEVQAINERLKQLSDSDWEEAYQLEMRRSYLMRHGHMLDFGTPFDFGGEEAALGYYEKRDEELTREQIIWRDNRRMLANAMRKADFAFFPHEWWHFNSKKTQMGAKAAGLMHAIYSGADFSEENMLHEQMRRQHYEGSRIIWETGFVSLPSRLEDAPSVFVLLSALEGVRRTGNPRDTYLDRADIIAPQ